MNLENITLGDISGILTFLAGIIAAAGAVAFFMRKRFVKVLQEELKPLYDKVDDLTKKTEQIDIDNCKNYLQQQISSLDAGEKIGSAAIQRFYENYDHYTYDLHMNSWVHSEVKRLEAEGKLKRK